MAKFRIEVSATAEKQIRKLNRTEQIRILRAIRELAEDPHPRGVRKLQGYNDVFRMRVASYRILYSVESRRLLILMLKIGHRKDVYRSR
ncbi:MAG: type II toxin-antitoxin system RelE/ParE family toxin [Gammaproteobacteria bacterium]|nr:type II toxin-antitoxin system RelE/ParE family toxin [Gammaproteobacteria bacterium]